MRSRLRQIKTLDPSARVLGLDVGRKYTGVAISDPQLLFAKPLKTINQLSDQLGMEGDIREVARLINNIIRSKNVKGLIVGYPLDKEMLPTRHCNYIEEFLN